MSYTSNFNNYNDERNKLPKCNRFHRFMVKCPICNDWYTSDRADKAYCTSACRSRAYRAAKRLKAGYFPDTKSERSRRSKRGAETKRRTFAVHTCQWCGITYDTNVLRSAKAKFCSAACKQKNYRHSKID